MEICVGTKVKFIGAVDAQTRWGGNDDPRMFLIVGEVYEVQSVEVHTWHTKIVLKQFPGKRFNSVCFEPVE